MPTDSVANSLPKPESEVVADELLQLTISVIFDGLPVVSNPNHGPGEDAVKPISPVIRFPVQLGAKDARVVEQAFYSAFPALIAFQINNADGSPRFYRIVKA